MALTAHKANLPAFHAAGLWAAARRRAWLQDRHTHPADRNPWGSVRIGRILEDLDSLAGLVAFDHWWGGRAGGIGGTGPGGGPALGRRAAAVGPARCCLLPNSSLACRLAASLPGAVHASRNFTPAALVSWRSLAAPCPVTCSDDGDPSTRPPLLVTATVEAIQLRSSQLTLEEDMEVLCMQHASARHPQE